jgi:hypothetical protein
MNTHAYDPKWVRTYALQNEKSCKGGFIQTLGNKRKISKKTRPYDGLGSDCVSPMGSNVVFKYRTYAATLYLGLGECHSPLQMVVKTLICVSPEIDKDVDHITIKGREKL